MCDLSEILGKSITVAFTLPVQIMLSDPHSLNIKYLKLINHTASQRKEWSGYAVEFGHEFYLHWAMNEERKKDLNEVEIKKILAHKEKDAKKAVEGDRILLCQNHYEHGHRVTHVVETITAAAEEKDGMWARQVRVIWVAQEPWETYAPPKEDIIGTEFSFRGGNLISVNAPSISLNLEKLTKR